MSNLRAKELQTIDKAFSETLTFAFHQLVNDFGRASNQSQFDKAMRDFNAKLCTARNARSACRGIINKGHAVDGDHATDG